MEDDRLDQLRQLGYIVNSVDKHKEHFEEILEMKPFSILDNRPANEVHYENEDRMVKIKNGLFNVGSLQVELIEVLEGKCYQGDWLKENGPGIHHLAFFTDNLDNQIKKFEELGIEVIQTGNIMGGIKFAYAKALDTLGVDIEIVELKKRKKKKK